MNKVNKWKKKMNTYYSELQSPQLLSDLEDSGFKMSSASDCRSQLYTQLTVEGEVAAGLELKETIVSKDGSVAMVLR